MEDKNYWMTMAVTGIVLIASLIYLAATTDAFAARNDSAIEELQIPIFEAIPEQTVNCALCHREPENLTEHINGGNYCASCHGTELHELHNKDTGHNLTCSVCHGSAASIPQRLPGHSSVCDSCHGYPDPLAPSSGNLIIIHTSRGHACDICHVQDLKSLHKVETKRGKYSGFRS